MNDGWAQVETLGSESEAALVAGFLESRGIPARVESRFFRQEPVTFGPMADVRLLVEEERVAEARGLLAERRARFGVIDGEATDDEPADDEPAEVRKESG